MNKIFRILAGVLLGLLPMILHAQMAGLHGDEREIRKGLHDGNLFRVTVYNDGTFGSIDNTVDFAGEWPVGSGHIYLVDGNTFIGGEVIDTTGQVKHIISENRSSMIQKHNTISAEAASRKRAAANFTNFTKSEQQKVV